MQIDKLQIELRPRSNAQALDLGFALLRSHAGAAYKAYFALWLPLIGVCAVLTVFFPALAWLWMLGAWWFKPILERAPLYVLSRQVFGTSVTWQEAVRAWPKQLGGGAFRLLTWGRIFAAGRSVQQPVWQLEMARGKVASARMRVLNKKGTGQSAFWFGIVCAHLEVVLQLGLMGLIGIFISGSGSSNPFALFASIGNADADPVLELVMLSIYAVCSGIIAPIYTACGFTLYLNRRASLEAWDLELQLRQIRRPVSAKLRAQATQSFTAVAAALVLAAAIALPSDVMAAQVKGKGKCEAPKSEQIVRGQVNSPQQTQIRKDVDQVFSGIDLRGYECKEVWQPKKSEPKKPVKDDPLDLGPLAAIFKVLIIALAIGLIAWLLYRYRHRFRMFALPSAAALATEVGGLDIRAESLPDRVTDAVRALWAAGERRAALALLYRATLSRLVTENRLPLRQGNTEGDCLRLARQAVNEQRLGAGRLEVAAAATSLWLNGAYADRWPDSAAVLARCSDWDAQFGPGTGGAP